MHTRVVVVWLALVAAVPGLACSPGATGEPNTGGEEIASPYVLPFPVGRTYLCFNSYGGPISHQGAWYYSVDFDMPIGTVVTAVRPGVVEFAEGGYADADTDIARANVVVIRHDDSTFSRYAHLTHDGALVVRGQVVAPGDTVGLSGSSGSMLNGAPKAHLHFDVTRGCSQIGCQTVPVLFRNARPAHRTLVPGVWYSARPD